MIKFEIYSLYENIPPVQMTIHYPRFLIGNSSRCHLKLKSKKSSFPIVRCENKEGRLYLETTNDRPFLLNGKKILGLANVQVNDLLKFEDISFRILEATPPSQGSDLNHEELYDDFYTQKEEYESVLSAIEKELIYSTDDVTSAKKGSSDEL